jgi:hypothetical protein
MVRPLLYPRTMRVDRLFTESAYEDRVADNDTKDVTETPKCAAWRRSIYSLHHMARLAISHIRRL